MILAEVRMTYRAPAFYGETLAVETRVVALGRTSFSMEHRITASDSRYGTARLVATAGSVLVTYDYTAGQPIPLPSSLVKAIETFEGRRLRSTP